MEKAKQLHTVLHMYTLIKYSTIIFSIVYYQ